MLGKLLPALLALSGLAAGAGAGLYLRPSGTVAMPESGSANPDKTAEPGAHSAHGAEAPDASQTPAEDRGANASAEDHSAPVENGEKPAQDYVKISNQFVVPVVQNGRVAALVILSLSLEVPPGSTEKVYKVEPKLRDGFLQVMFDHANAGGFMGTFTDGSSMILLREALREVAQGILGPDVTDVLIVDIVRQDS